MSTPIHVLLKANFCLEYDVGDDKAYPLMCLQLNQIFVLQYIFFKGWIHGPPTCALGTGCFFKEVFATVVTLFW